MFIPPSNYKDSIKTAKKAENKVQLKSSHLVINHKIAKEAFGDQQNVNVVYYSDRHTLMIAPISDEIFKSLHKANKLMLKEKNLKGDKSIALHEILIDHQVDDTDRELVYELQPGLGILNVKL